MKKPKKKNSSADQQELFVMTHPVETTRPVEITPEQQQERDELAGLLLQQTEEHSRERAEKKKQRDQEVIELVGGGTTTLGALKALVAPRPQPYEPYFPYTIPFFSEIYRLNGWHHLDYREYVKPKKVAIWIKELIYDRFSQEVYPTLRRLNRKGASGGWVYKHSQRLTPAGILELKQYRDEAIAIMQTCSTWYEFRVKLYKAHGVPYQVSLFEPAE